MHDFILFMHGDAVTAPSQAMWTAYFSDLRRRGAFEGGSAIGEGQSFRKPGTPAATSDHLTGYIRVRAENLAAVEALLAGNPVFECGGTVEIRELPRD